jgi:hypothetical protein
MRGALPVPQSVSDSAVVRETPSVIEDHQLAFAQAFFRRGFLERVSKGISSKCLWRIYAYLFIFITDDHQLPNTSEPILPGTHGTSLLARAHESVHRRLLHDLPYKQGHGHSPKVSQAEKHSAESSRHA